MNLHIIGDDELAALTDENRVIGYFAPASNDGVLTLLAAPIDGPDVNDGRSEWRWVRLIDGALMLATYPHGDTYMTLEKIVAADFAAVDTDRFARLRKLVRKTKLAAYGDSNDSEIETLQAALDEALGFLDVDIPDLTDDEIDKLSDL